jgi:hypothetical protein
MGYCVGPIDLSTFRELCANLNGKQLWQHQSISKIRGRRSVVQGFFKTKKLPPIMRKLQSN